jgi:hypothetical protein
VPQDPAIVRLADRRAEHIRTSTLKGLIDMQRAANLTAFDRAITGGINTRRALQALGVDDIQQHFDPLQEIVEDLFLDAGGITIKELRGETNPAE